MHFIPTIQIGEIVTRERIYDEFGCQQQKGIAHSKIKNALVLISDWTDPKYHDRWDEDILYYTGAGLRGDQELNLFNNNLKLAESKKRGINLYLFEQFKEKELTYRGQVILVGDVKSEIQKDIDGNPRKAYIFPLQIIDTDRGKSLLDINRVLAYQIELDEIARRLTPKKLLEKISSKNTTKSSKRTITSVVYERDPNVSEFVKRRANGLCDLCKKRAPFENQYGEAYLESHHLVWLSEGGDDDINNTVALCPNCHRKMHIVNCKNDMIILKNRLIKYQEQVSNLR